MCEHTEHKNRLESTSYDSIFLLYVSIIKPIFEVNIMTVKHQDSNNKILNVGHKLYFTKKLVVRAFKPSIQDYLRLMIEF